MLPACSGIIAQSQIGIVIEVEVPQERPLVAVISLIKAYLRLGGFIGDGAFVDHQFNTTDVCLVLDTARMNPRRAAIYGWLA